MDAKLQLNGLVLLYAYLRRAYDYRTMLRLLGERVDQAELDALSPMLERTSGAIRDFDPDEGLDPAAAAEFDGITGQVASFTEAFVPHDGADPRRQLAAVAAAVYAEEHVNDGIVHMGDLLDPELADRFRQRTLHFQQRTATVTSWVKTVAADERLDAESASQRDELVDQVIEASANIDSDLATIRRFIAS